MRHITRISPTEIEINDQSDATRVEVIGILRDMADKLELGDAHYHGGGIAIDVSPCKTLLRFRSDLELRMARGPYV